MQIDDPVIRSRPVVRGRILAIRRDTITLYGVQRHIGGVGWCPAPGSVPPLRLQETFDVHGFEIDPLPEDWP